VKNLLARKLEKTKAPVYNYLFAWEYPINGGITSFHCSELAFCFHALNVPQIRTATGGGPVAMACRTRSRRRGSTSRDRQSLAAGLEWKPYTKETRRRWSSTPSASRSRSATTSWCRCYRQLPVAEEHHRRPWRGRAGRD
jgi:hypothetical protein